MKTIPLFPKRLSIWYHCVKREMFSLKREDHLSRICSAISGVWEGVYQLTPQFFYNNYFVFSYILFTSNQRRYVYENIV